MDEREFIGLVVEYPPPDLCTYKEYAGKPYFSIKYMQNGETFIGFGTYKVEVLSQYLKEYFIRPTQPEQTTEKGGTKMIHETVNIGEMDIDLTTTRDTTPYVRISINSVSHSTYLTMQEVNDLLNTLSSFLDRASATEEETSESLLKNFLETNMDVCNVTPIDAPDAPPWSNRLIDAAIASPNENGYYWASITDDKYSLTLYPICYTKNDEDGWLLPACFKSKVKCWYPKKLKTKFDKED